ncbi:acetyl-CoA carboxylase, carboxyltransferase subunit beta [Helicobacter heilmannii]|uniref:Acetyl-coenzyme A carboxylase carboxyl transferase subunit beta n=1 Tax=Helicobacter heilmannii TaxID=35817 RepID=A0A0K2Y6J5_HELHE|nr:acetyl-CoA carboxylase, carboxyltransferase subunit beta [Helicobacter heilmannii]CCM10893.1 Acetyl-coenzyme A carboxyl transferase beta chain [Helicobacter heilmannii ASB1.4]CRF45076.1 Acetyl-coenzyme A carboxyl transferase beta chain [Helicobacter heilmannii]CRF50918.1 Acetyl-coenzyme A carboxyl transferase beta chain [Helicobacter heilmannii]CRI33717.1 Acetyl-coenzyme A carboxyl transferase beta chain [Helicobacter heilmannii]GMB95032.1 Acetyl-CoA carboxylase subunit beta AccD [Helicobac
MGFADFLKNLKKTRVQSSEQDMPSHWIKCPKCAALMYYKEVFAKNHVCLKCHYHFRMGASERLAFLCDENTFTEYDNELRPVDPLNFVDKESYKQRIKKYEAKTGRPSSVISGEGQINGIALQIVVFDFAFMGGSLGSVEGEKIVRAINRAVAKEQALLIVSASGGARMQESTYSLMQMAKTSAALNRLTEAKLPFISLLTDPTFGGVSASFAFLGDLIIAEPGAMVGFAGARVIKQTIGAELPAGFQSAEFLLEHGLIDMIVQRKDLKKTLSDLVGMLTINR